MTIPKIGTKNYHSFMESIVKFLETKLNISVYGYSDYNRISFHWLDENKMIIGDPCSIPFSVAKRMFDSQ